MQARFKSQEISFDRFDVIGFVQKHAFVNGLNNGKSSFKTAILLVCVGRKAIFWQDEEKIELSCFFLISPDDRNCPTNTIRFPKLNCEHNTLRFYKQ